MADLWTDPKTIEARLERRYGSRMAAYVLARAIEFLKSRGQRLLNRMANTHDTKRQTGAQENAYLMGIYLDGDLIILQFPAVRPQREPKDDKYWGRAEAVRYLEENRPEEAGLTAVFVQAMWYSYIQEELGTGRTGRTWRITSQCDAMAAEIAADYNARFPNMPCRFGRLQDQGGI